LLCLRVKLMALLAMSLAGVRLPTVLPGSQQEEERDPTWDAWGPWSECSRTCGGGASYSIRRCLAGRSCVGQTIRYKSCSTEDCPADAGDFRAQQCSAHNDVKFRGQYREWQPVYEGAEKPCALYCVARGTSLVEELSPKVLDGTRCAPGSLDMCISGICQALCCIHKKLVKRHNRNVRNTLGSTDQDFCIEGTFLSVSKITKTEDTVIAIPFGSRQIKITVKGPDQLLVETKTLQGRRGEISLTSAGTFSLENSSLEFQRHPGKRVLHITGPIQADFTIKARHVSSAETVVLFLFYQPIPHQWRETDFFPCSSSCGGGYQLTSAECVDMRNARIASDHFCNYYPENKKPKPRLRECSMEPCPSSDGFKQIMSYDHYQPLPRPCRWEGSPWTACSSSCGGGVQSRSVSCVEEDQQGHLEPVEEWKCMYVLRPAVTQPCNLYDCPKWMAQEWSSCTVTCGRGLKYRVVLCIDHRGQHTGGCNTKIKPHVKEECLVTTPCYKPREKLPVEAKVPWFKQAQELIEGPAVSEEAAFAPDAWSPCSRSCGPGVRTRAVRCRVLLPFSRSVVELPDGECEGERPASERPCALGPCVEAADGLLTDEEAQALEERGQGGDEALAFDWEYGGFSHCSVSCAGGNREAIVICVNKETGEAEDESLCDADARPPQIQRPCHTLPCPSRWETSEWGACSASCGAGLRARSVGCARTVAREADGSEERQRATDCTGPRPPDVEPCARSDCPPAWHARDWQPCSRTCGSSGVQSRSLRCRRLLADGSSRDVDEQLCPDSRPLAQQACGGGQSECPAEWVASEWGQINTHQGNYTQHRDVSCQFSTAAEATSVANASQCSSLPKPLASRACTLPPCNRKGGSSANGGPQILGVRRIYIPSPWENLLAFPVGGTAYLFPKSMVVLKCPVARFQHSRVRWEKDGRSLAESDRHSVTRWGCLKIRCLQPDDIGVYTCVAGQARESFTIKLIGENSRVLEAPGHKERNGDGKAKLNEATGPEGGALGKQPQKGGDKRDVEKSRQHIVSLLLESKLLTRERMESRDSRESLERDSNLSSSEEEELHLGREPSVPWAYVTDQEKLQQIMRNLTQHFELPELSDVHAAQIIAQLAAEPRAKQKQWADADENESSMRSEDKSLDSEPQEGLKENAHARKAKPSGHVARPPSSWPSLRRQARSALTELSKDVTVHVGGLAVVGLGTRSLALLCPVEGPFVKTHVAWSRDGTPVATSRRVLLLPDKSLKILNPGVNDAGLYTCSATAEAGTDHESTLITFADYSYIAADLVSIRNTITGAVLAVHVGASVSHVDGLSITITMLVHLAEHHCVSWTSPELKTGSQHHHHLGADCTITNVNGSRQGTHKVVACRAARGYGELLKQVNTLFLQPPRYALQFASINIFTLLTAPSLVMDFPRDSKVEVILSVGCHALKGCPVVCHPFLPVTWLHGGQAVAAERDADGPEFAGGGRLLVLPPASAGLPGHYSCSPSHAHGGTHCFAARKVALVLPEHRWFVNDTASCPASCGNASARGAPAPRCVRDNVTVVSDAFCSLLPRPQLPTNSPCPAVGCQPWWVTGPWSDCSEACGAGVRVRSVVCRSPAGATALPDYSCRGAERPARAEPCKRHGCPEWAVGAWAECTGRCVGLGIGTQHRRVLCFLHNGTAAPEGDCASKARPGSVQNCSVEACAVQWRTGPWAVCTASCGTHGFQARRVECAHVRTARPAPDAHCAWQHKPATWQRCNITPCATTSECRDSSRYCEMVQKLNLCQLPTYRLRCCQACRES
uniref:ADAMTS-like 3 n=1 Tax=Petromyzon marinus TaxID=7757 RepID=S4R4M5_PETMA